MTSDRLDLLDYRSRVSALYAQVRAGGANDSTWSLWRSRRDGLFAKHPQSALDAAQQSTFSGLNYFEYDRAYDEIGDFQPAAEIRSFPLEFGGDKAIQLERIGEMTIVLPGGVAKLNVYWINDYGGGIFIPFRDASNGVHTYGGGRYLYDSSKGADLGSRYQKLIMNFNYAYNPSCAYNPRWICPLAPLENRLDFAIMAGERNFEP